MAKLTFYRKGKPVPRGSQCSIHWETHVGWFGQGCTTLRTDKAGSVLIDNSLIADKGSQPARIYIDHPHGGGRVYYTSVVLQRGGTYALHLEFAHQP